MNMLKKKQPNCLNYFLQYSFWFLLLAVLSFLINFNGEKQVIDADAKLNNLLNFGIVLANNTILFIYTLAAVFIGKVSIYVMIFVNSIRLGMLISQFMYPSYMLLILPHGILEMSVYILLGSVVSKYIDEEKKEGKPLLKKALWLYVGIIISAAIEAWITPMLVFRFVVGI